MGQSNIDINPANSTFNTGLIKTYLEPSLWRTLVFVPKGTVIPASAMITPAAFKTYVDALFVSDPPRKNRWFSLVNLDEFKDSTKAMSIDDTGLNQTPVIKYNPLYETRYLTNMGNYIESLGLDNCQDFYDVYIIDLNGSWIGTEDDTNSGGLASLDLQNFRVLDRVWITDKKLNMYPLRIQLANRTEINEQFQYYAAKYNALKAPGLVNVVLTDVEAALGSLLAGFSATTDFVFTAKWGEGSSDFVQEFAADLTAACVVAYNLTAGAPATVASIQVGTISTGGQVYNYVWGTLSAPPTTADVVNIALAAPSVTFPIIASYVITEDPNTIDVTF